MTQENLKPTTVHEQVWALLPWYINQTLSDEERILVKNHLSECVTCHGELKSQQILCDAVKESPPHELYELMQFSQLMQRIKSDKNKAVTHKRKTSFWRTPSLAIAAMLVAVMVIPLSVVLQESTPTLYQTLTSAFESDNQPTGDIRVIFDPMIEAKIRDELLHNIDGKIVQPANKNGVFIIQILSANNEQNITHAINYLRRNSQVVFVEPTYSTK